VILLSGFAADLDPKPESLVLRGGGGAGFETVVDDEGVVEEEEEEVGAGAGAEDSNLDARPEMEVDLR